MLLLEDVTAYYDRLQVLHGVSLYVQSGQILGLLGRNGAGKTTTLRAVMGLVDKRGGTLEVGGVVLERVAPHRMAAHGVAYVPQGRRLFASLTVEENLRMGLLASKRPKPGTLGEVLELFPALGEKLKAPARALSGGQQQMVAMGRALCTRPKVLLLDEPTEGLQPSLVERILETIEELRRSGVAILLVEQKVDAALKVVDEVAFIENGRVCERSSAASLREDPAPLVRYVGVRRAG